MKNYRKYFLRSGAWRNFSKHLYELSIELIEKMPKNIPGENSEEKLDRIITRIPEGIAEARNT